MGIPSEKVERVKKYSESIKSELIIHEYDEAEHGFNCQDRKSFNKKSSELALARSLEFIDKIMIKFFSILSILLYLLIKTSYFL